MISMKVSWLRASVCLPFFFAEINVGEVGMVGIGQRWHGIVSELARHFMSNLHFICLEG